MSKNTRYIEAFLEMLLAERNVANNTVLSYKNDLKNLLKHAEGCPLENLNKEFFGQYFNSLKAQSSASIARKLSCFKQFFNFLISEGTISESPLLNFSPPRKEKSLPKPLNSEEIKKITDYLNSLDNSPEHIRLATIVYMLYSSGMRVSELISLKLPNLKTEYGENFIMVSGKGNVQRLCLISSVAKAKLTEYLRIRNTFCKGVKNSWVFPSIDKQGAVSKLSRQRIGQLLKDLSIKAGVDPERVSPHKFRHSVASHMLEGGSDIRTVQEILGHKSISSTQIYTKVNLKQAKEALAKHPINKIAENE